MTDAPDLYVAQVVKALAASGASFSARVVLDACGSLDLGGILRGLRRCGADARLVRVRSGDLSYLPPHSLVWLDDGPPALLLRAGPRHVELELADGTRRRVGGKDLASVKSRAIAVRPRPRGDGTFIDRALASLREDARSARSVALVVGLGLVTTALGILSPLLSRAALNEAIPERAPAKLGAVAVAAVLLFAHSAWAGWLRRRALVFLETRLGEIGVEQTVRHLLGLPFATLARLEVGRVLEVARVAQQASSQLLTIATSLLDGIVALGYLAFVFWLDTWSGLAALVGAVLLFGLGMLVGRRSYERRSALLEANRKQQQVLYETIAGIETVKAEAAEEPMLVRFLKRLVTVQGLAVEEQLETAVHSMLSLAIDRLVYGIILMLVAVRALRDQANVGDLMAAIQASASFFGSAQTLARVPTNVYTLRAQVKQVDAMLDEPTEALEPPTATAAAPEGEEAISLRNVWFRYDSAAPWVLKGLTFPVPRGATVVLEWPSGAGKSTLLRILAGLLGPERGDALIFGTEAARARHLVTYLPQHAPLLPMSLMDNLRLLSGGVPMERIAQAANATGLAEMVKAWPMGFETLVSAGSTNVSSGQRQLVLFTAAIASAAPVLLLDEAFAHMDGVMRSRLASLDLLRGRTVIAVVHDASLRERQGATATLVLGSGENPAVLARTSRAPSS